VLLAPSTFDLQVSFSSVSIFNSFGYLCRCGLARKYGSSLFNFWTNCQIVFHNGCTFYILTIGVQGFPFLCILASIVVFLFVWIVVIVMGVKCYLLLVRICIS
jgi:hypothetical protein